MTFRLNNLLCTWHRTKYHDTNNCFWNFRPSFSNFSLYRDKKASFYLLKKKHKIIAIDVLNHVFVRISLDQCSWDINDGYNRCPRHLVCPEFEKY